MQDEHFLQKQTASDTVHLLHLDRYATFSFIKNTPEKRILVALCFVLLSPGVVVGMGFIFNVLVDIFQN